MADARVPHPHCQSCVKISRCTKNAASPTGDSCDIIYCEKKCGARFHSCKEEEHNLLCPNLKEPCINAIYGCPHFIKRSERGNHLQSCPASCVPCTAEWNRWPLCSKERHVPFAHVNPQLKEEYLDVALALRDQEKLNHWMNLPRKIQKLMRCTLTPRHPGIPLVPTLWNPASKRKLKSISSDDGLLLNASMESTPRQSAERSDTSLISTTSTDDESPWGRRRKPPGLLQSVCAQLFNSKAQGQPLPQQEENHKLEEEIEDDNTLSDISNDLDDSGDLNDSAFTTPCEFPENPPALPLLTTLGIDLSIECVPRYMHKPKSMYTFICAQDFRRDEYASHYRNWHSEIHGGLDGWIEQRCPLARYGCSYARRRMHPGPDARVIYSSIVQSFGVVPLVTSEQNPSASAIVERDGALQLCDLPFELLRTITGYLDAFSICHLALTCRLLRDVARSLLHHRGLVNPHWQKTRQGWRITNFRWSFSTAFTPVDHWVFEESDHMSNHLKQCRYYIKSDYVYPDRVALPGCLNPELL